MSRPKVGVVGLAILAAFVLNIVSVFTDGWIVVSVKVVGLGKSSYSQGIIPFSSNEAGWFAAASWMMFISFALFFIVTGLYFFAAWQVHHHGCSHSISHHFHGVSLLCIILAILQTIAFILVACNATSYYGYLNYAKASSSVGYSGYLALVSAIFSVVAMGLSAHVAKYDCC